MSDQLLTAWILVQYTPQADVVVGCQFHALEDEFLTLDVVVEVGHHVQQPVDEYHRRLVLPDSLQRHAPSDNGRIHEHGSPVLVEYRLAVLVELLHLFHVAQHDDIEVVILPVDVAACHRQHSVLHGNGIVFLHLRVDVEYSRVLNVRQFVAQLPEFAAKDGGHELRQRHRLAVTRLARDVVDASEWCERYAFPRQRVSWWLVCLAEVQQVGFDVVGKPIVTL